MSASLNEHYVRGALRLRIMVLPQGRKSAPQSPLARA